MSSLLIVADRAGEEPVALPRGLALAERMGWDADVVAFCYESLGSIHDRLKRIEARHHLTEQRRAEVAAEIERLKPPDVAVDLTVAWDRTVHLWVDTRCARKHYAAVITKGHRTGSFLYTSTDWHLLREAAAPVMIAAEHQWSPTRSIVAAVDLHTRSRAKRALNTAIIETARRYADAGGCPLHLVYAIHVPHILTELGLMDGEAHARRIAEDMHPVTDRLCDEHGIPRENLHIHEGDVAHVIADEAERLQAQLVVMGTVGRHGVGAKVLGNAAERVLTVLRTDVLALKPGMGPP